MKKTVLFMSSMLLCNAALAQVPVPVPLSTISFFDGSYPRVEPAYSYNFGVPVNADVLAESPANYEPEYSNRYYMSIFGPRYKEVSSSSIGYFDFHQGEDITTDVSYGGVDYDEDNPPDILSMCDGTVDRIVDGPDADMEQTGEGRFVRVRCNATFNGNSDWGNIYMAYRHLESVDAAMIVGNPILQGDVVGVMGQSGHTSTTHLHFSVRRHDGSDFHNVHPMRVFDPTATPHLLEHLQGVEIAQLEYNATSALFRIAVPYNQAVIRAITVSTTDGAYTRTYDFEHISEFAGSDRDHHDYIDGLELFAYPYNHGHIAFRRYMEKKAQMPAAYPASPQRGDGNYYPILNEGIFSTPAYVLDLRANDLPVGYDINDVEIEVIGIYGHGVTALATSVQNSEQFTFSAVSNDDDDAEEHDDGDVDLDSSDLELVNDGDKGDQTIGLRFSGLGIPQGSPITNAYIQFMADETDDDDVTLTIRAENVDSAAALTDADFDLSSRVVTNSNVTWEPNDWDNVGEAGTLQRTPNLASVIQQVVSRPGWTTTSDLAILITGSSAGKRVAESHDASAWKAPYLYVEYDQNAAPANQAPAAALTSPVDNAGYTSLDTITISATAADVDGTIARAEFYANDLYIGEVYNSPYDINWTIPSYGDHELYAIAVDDDGDSTQTNSVTIQVFENAIDVAITQSHDDVEEHQDGSIAKEGSDLELCYDDYVSSGGVLYGDQYVGLRFQNVLVPQGAVITRAYVQFTADETDDDAVDLTIYGEDSDSAAAFSYTAYDVSNRPSTFNTVSWQPADWDLVGQAGDAERTPDLSAIIQDIVDRPNWAAGNALAIILEGTGTRVAESYDGSVADAPVLHIEFSD